MSAKTVTDIRVTITPLLESSSQDVKRPVMAAEEIERGGQGLEKIWEEELEETGSLI